MILYVQFLDIIFSMAFYLKVLQEEIKTAKNTSSKNEH